MHIKAKVRRDVSGMLRLSLERGGGVHLLPPVFTVHCSFDVSFSELEVECAAQLRRVGDTLNSLGCTTEALEVLAEMAGKKARKSSEPDPARARAGAESWAGRGARGNLRGL